MRLRRKPCRSKAHGPLPRTSHFFIHPVVSVRRSLVGSCFSSLEVAHALAFLASLRLIATPSCRRAFLLIVHCRAPPLLPPTRYPPTPPTLRSYALDGVPLLGGFATPKWGKARPPGSTVDGGGIGGGMGVAGPRPPPGLPPGGHYGPDGGGSGRGAMGFGGGALDFGSIAAMQQQAYGSDPDNATLFVSGFTLPRKVEPHEPPASDVASSALAAASAAGGSAGDGGFKGGAEGEGGVDGDEAFYSRVGAEAAREADCAANEVALRVAMAEACPALAEVLGSEGGVEVSALAKGVMSGTHGQS